ncbi:MAG TPA: ABC transporter ATP-binding protein [Candidatus Saccharimonadales bacterium]|nr:ABC transporter ATP-binding protein [Candidatus Saccharimonadales bacterium]
METVVKIKNLSVTLGSHFRALKNINLDLPAGKTIGFIGPSGAGKTTLIRGIVGSLRATSGEINVFNEKAGSANLRKQVSYMTQELSVYPDLTVKENLKYFVTMAGQPRRKTEAVVSEVLETVDLTSKSASLVRDLSSGQKQRVSLAIALIGSPKLLVLDEPTVGLDPVLRKKLWNLFADLANNGATLIISSHSMDEAERCDDLVLIRDGRLIAHSSPKKLLQRTGTKTIEESFLKLVGDKE